MPQLDSGKTLYREIHGSKKEWLRWEDGVVSVALLGERGKGV